MHDTPRFQNGFRGVHISRNLLYFHSICPKFNNTNGSYLEVSYFSNVFIILWKDNLSLRAFSWKSIVKRLDKRSEKPPNFQSCAANEWTNERTKRKGSKRKEILFLSNLILHQYSTILKNRNFHSNPYKSFNKQFKTMVFSNKWHHWKETIERNINR